MLFSVLHPGLKLDYFRLCKWDPEWIKNAEKLTRDAFEDHYDSMEVEAEAPLLVRFHDLRFRQMVTDIL